MAPWRKRLFIATSYITADAAEYFGLALSDVFPMTHHAECVAIPEPAAKGVRLNGRAWWARRIPTNSMVLVVTGELDDPAVHVG
ncbi:hypothetical protein [Streptomyces shenzhenensis]|uniref:hypothetical protein n=1 Tax=Streptomyces shenzhenensis TaxID=943815 RepID=UPI0015F0ECB4|nr:hypothetical protein [Streptomyces shenzhenensis]